MLSSYVLFCVLYLLPKWRKSLGIGCVIIIIALDWLDIATHGLRQLSTVVRVYQ